MDLYRILPSRPCLAANLPRPLPNLPFRPLGPGILSRRRLEWGETLALLGLLFLAIRWIGTRA